MKILIADDHEIVRRGLMQVLTDEFGSIGLGQSRDSRETLEQIRKQSWDAVLLDLNMPGQSGLEVLEQIRQLRPKLPVLILTAFPEQDYALRALKLGAAGYLSKQSAASELIVALRKALSGKRYITPALAERLADALAGETPALPHETLSNRELQILRLIATGKTLKEISAELTISEKTVATYRTRISGKMNLSTNVELTRYAMKHGLSD